MSRLPHVVWDMGGVMYRYFTELMVDEGRRRSWPLEIIALGPTGKIPDPNYDRMLNGEFGEPEYLKLIVADLEANGIDFNPLHDLSWEAQQRRETWEAIEQIHRAGHRQALLTNDASKWLGDGWWEAWEPARWFEAVIDVVTIGVRKPAPQPYLAAAEALQASTADCLFIDDMPANCAGAEAVGMDSHLFDITAPTRSLRDLKKRLGIVQTH